MGRELKRVPLDFNYPLHTIWSGYDASASKDKVHWWKDYQGDSICKECDRIHNNCFEDAEYCLYHPDNKAIWYYDPPKGEGYQLWETTTEGSPVSPVFETLEALCEWCEDNATVFANIKVTKEEWMKMLNDNFFYYKSGNAIFI
jgi:hypothetical protein